VIGAPSFATAAKGEQFLEYAAAKLGDMLEEVLKTRYRKG